MQETVNHQNVENPQRKPRLALGVAIIALAVILVAVSAVQVGIAGNYNQGLSKLKELVAAASGQAQSGDTDAGATLSDQYRFYLSLDAQVKNLSDIYGKLNASYPLYLFRASRSNVGLAALETTMAELSPKLTILKTAIDEDKTVDGQLQALLTAPPDNASTQYTGLVVRNDKLKDSVAALKFTGALEAGRAALEQAVSARSQAMVCLGEDASINEALKAILSDVSQPFDTIASQLTDLGSRSDALAAKLQGLDLSACGEAGSAVASGAASRTERIKTDIEYVKGLAPLQTNLKAFCANLGPAPAGKLADKMATYTNWLNGLKDLRAQLDAVNADAKYAKADKLTVDDLGMTQAGKDLLAQESVLASLTGAMATSGTIETQIDATMKDTKTRMATKVEKLTALVSDNQTVIQGLSVQGSPADMADQLAAYIQGCNQREQFLNDYMDYLIAKDNATNASKTIPTVPGAAQDQARQQYNSLVKIAQDDQKKYEASFALYHKTMAS